MNWVLGTVQALFCCSSLQHKLLSPYSVLGTFLRVGNKDISKRVKVSALKELVF